MINYITIGSSPCDEPCAQVGSENYHENARKEGKAFINQLRRQFGPEPASASLRIKGFPHDFGTYHEVVCYYDSSDDVGADYAFRLESEMPAEWDQQAKQELAQ